MVVRKRLSSSFVLICTILNLLFVQSVEGTSASPSENRVHGHQAKETKSTVKDLSAYTNITQVAVIGGGIGGLAAAQITARRNLHTVVFQGEVIGGQMNNTSSVFNWLGVLECKGRDIVRAIKKQALHRGAILDTNSVVNVDFSRWPYVLHLSNGDHVHALSVIIATGAQFRKLNVPGEKEYAGKGILSSSVYDKDRKWKGKSVVVIGSGDDAVRKAEIFAGVANEVTMLIRGKELKVAQAVKTKLENKKNIKILYNTSVSEVFGNGKTVQGVLIKNGEEVRKLPCDIISVAIGIEPQSSIFKSFISCNKDGYIHLPGRTQATSLQGVFAVGDVTEDIYRKAVIAGSDGIKAGYDAAAFLKEKQGDLLSKSVKQNLYKSSTHTTTESK